MFLKYKNKTIEITLNIFYLFFSLYGDNKIEDVYHNYSLCEYILWQVVFIPSLITPEPELGGGGAPESPESPAGARVCQVSEPEPEALSSRKWSNPRFTYPQSSVILIIFPSKHLQPVSNLFILPSISQ